MYYALVGIISLVLLLILNYDVLFDPHYKAKKPEALTAFRAFLYSVGIFFIADTCWGIFDDLQSRGLRPFVGIGRDTAFVVVVIGDGIVVA